MLYSFSTGLKDNQFLNTTVIEHGVDSPKGGTSGNSFIISELKGRFPQMWLNLNR